MPEAFYSIASENKREVKMESGEVSPCGSQGRSPNIPSCHLRVPIALRCFMTICATTPVSTPVTTPEIMRIGR